MPAGPKDAKKRKTTEESHEVPPPAQEQVTVPGNNVQVSEVLSTVTQGASGTVRDQLKSLVRTLQLGVEKLKTLDGTKYKSPS